MLPDLATSLSTTLATASLLFFLAVYAVVVVQVVRGRREDLDAHARMALDEAPVKGVAEPSVPS